MAAVYGQFLKVTKPADGVALVSMARSPVNAFCSSMWREVPLVFDHLSKDDSVRVVVLASAERIFTAGLDLNDTAGFAAQDADPSRAALAFRPLIDEFQVAISSIERCRVPVIAAVHGIAYGLGLDMLSACDIRYCDETSRFSIKEVDIGMAADVGSLARFPKIVGNESFTREVALTGREFNAKEALDVGFVSRVVTGGKEGVLSAALDLAKVIASKSPIAVLGTKHILLHSRDHSVQQNLDYTATWNSVMLQSEDMNQAIQSFTRKKTPTFRPLGPKLSKL